MINKKSEKIILKNRNPKFRRHFWEIKIHALTKAREIIREYGHDLTFSLHKCN